MLQRLWPEITGTRLAQRLYGRRKRAVLSRDARCHDCLSQAGTDYAGSGEEEDKEVTMLERSVKKNGATSPGAWAMGQNDHRPRLPVSIAALVLQI
jgi:hypothetical protein